MFDVSDLELSLKQRKDMAEVQVEWVVGIKATAPKGIDVDTHWDYYSGHWNLWIVSELSPKNEAFLEWLIRLECYGLEVDHWKQEEGGSVILVNQGARIYFRGTACQAVPTGEVKYTKVYEEVIKEQPVYKWVCPE